MKANICGYEAVEEGLNAGGIEKFLCGVTREPLCNAEKAVCKGSFFSSQCMRTACIISEKDVGALEHAVKNGDCNAGLEFIVLGRDQNDELLSFFESLGLPSMTAESVNDVRRMTRDAALYSELRKVPVVVYIPIRLLRCRQPAHIDGCYFCDCYRTIENDERKARIAALESGYNVIYEHPKAQREKRCLVICMPGCTKDVLEIAGAVKGVSMCRLDLIGCMHYREELKKYEKVIIIGQGSGYAEGMLRDKGFVGAGCVAVTLSKDKLHEMAEICTILREFLPAQKFEITGIEKNQRALSKRMAEIKADMRADTKAEMVFAEPITDSMCTDCPYRGSIQNILGNSTGIFMYEDIYCEKRGTMVRSGMANSYNAYSSDMVITNRSDSGYEGPCIKYINDKCDKS